MDGLWSPPSPLADTRSSPASHTHAWRTHGAPWGGPSQLSPPGAAPVQPPRLARGRCAPRPALPGGDTKGSARTQKGLEPTGSRATASPHTSLGCWMSPRVWFLVSPQHQTGTTGWVPVPWPYSPGSALLCPLRPPYPGGQPGHGSGQALPAQPGSRCGRFAGCELQEGAESSYFLPKCQLPAQSGSAGLRQLPPLPPAWCGRGHGAGAPCSLTPQQGTASPHGAESPPPVPPHPEGSQGRTRRTEVGGMREGWRAWTHLRPTAPLAAHGTGAKPLESNPRLPPCLLQAPQRAPQRAVEGSRRWNWRSSPLLRLHVVSSFR